MSVETESNAKPVLAMGTHQQQPSNRRPRGGVRAWQVAVLACAVAVPLALLSLRGTGALNKVLITVGLRTPKAPPPPPKLVPTFLTSEPADVATGTDPAAPLLIKYKLPNGPIDPATFHQDSVGLFRFDTRERIPATLTLETDGNVGVIRVVPLKPLEANRNYRYHVLPGLKDTKGEPLPQKSGAFFTSSQPPEGVAYVKVDQPAAQGIFTCVQFWKDGKLYASTIDGRIMRFTVDASGMLTNPETFAALPQSEKGPRLVTGFDIDPRSPVDAPVLYVPNSQLAASPTNPLGLEGAADFSGRISRISGKNLDKVETLVINLPQSARDHATNQPRFGPDGALYIPQPSNSAVGAPDAYWYMRPERLLSATILRLDVDRLPQGRPLDAKTKDAGGTYDPAAPGAPLTIYAFGLRMPYDLLWHSNGRLYTSVNGASSSGATPAGPGVPGVSYVNLAEHDWLFDVQKGQYYGHPNPQQGCYVLNGGNPTAAPDFNEVSDYPVGVSPDARWVPSLYDFGMHVSANGMVEVTSNRFGSALQGKVFVCRYNVGSDLLLLGFDDKGRVNYAASGIPGTSGLRMPLDVTEDPRTGNLYVCELGGNQITLLRATPGATQN